MVIKDGTTRRVILIGKYAIKIPQYKYQWSHFLRGLLGNMQEKLFWSMKDDKMCPVLFSIPGGWLIVMPRCKPISREDFDKLKIEDYKPIPVEDKLDSFGYYKGNIVAVDYGT